MVNLYRYTLTTSLKDIITDGNNILVNKIGQRTKIIRLDGNNSKIIEVNYEVRVDNTCVFIYFEEKETGKYIAGINLFIDLSIPNTLTFWGE